jgi:hypothetical protein
MQCTGQVRMRASAGKLDARSAASTNLSFGTRSEASGEGGWSKTTPILVSSSCRRRSQSKQKNINHLCPGKARRSEAKRGGLKEGRCVPRKYTRWVGGEL